MYVTAPRTSLGTKAPETRNESEDQERQRDTNILFKSASKSQPMIQLIGRKGTVGFDHLCVCDTGKPGDDSDDLCPILMCQTWHIWHHCWTCRCQGPVHQRTSSALYFQQSPVCARACVCRVFVSERVFFKEILLL